MFHIIWRLFFGVIFIIIVSGNPASLTARISHLIFPGTNWCGIGNIAKDFNDLGSEKQIDKCCREHDLCPEEIESGTTNYGLYNKYFISRLHCKCDKQLYNCLKNSTSAIADLIGNIYFNVLQYPCFAEKCQKKYTSWWGECSSNQISRKKQWFDLEKY